MNIKYILIGLLFFINPNIEIIDIFPDFIGAIFILKGISHLAPIEEKCSFARKAMLIFTYVNAAKTLMLLTFTVISKSEMTWMLVFTSCFGMAELALLIYFFVNLDKSLNYTSMVYDAPTVYNMSGSFTGLSVAFVSVKVVMSVLPEIVSLFDIDYGYVNNLGVNWEFVNGMLVFLNVIVVTSVGIVWYINSRRYLKSVAKEQKYLESIEERYQDQVGSKISLLTYRAFKTLSLLLVCGFVFMICIRLDGIDYLPDFIAAILFIAAAFRIRKLYKKYSDRILIASAVFFVVALAEWVLWMIFSNGFYSNENATISFVTKLEIYRGIDPDIDNNFLMLCLLDLLKTVSAIVCLLSFVPLIRDIIKEHTGAIPELRSEITAKKTAKIQKSMNIMTNFFIAFSVLIIPMDVISTALCIDLPTLTFVCTALGIVWAFYAWIYFGKLTESIENKYIY